MNALIAELHLWHRFSYAAMDLILDVIRDSRFDASQLSLLRAGDIDRRVSDQRRRDIQKICLPSQAGDAGISTVPHVVVSLVIDELLSQMVPFSEEAQCLELASSYKFQRLPPPNSELYRTFASMSVVHRSWTLPAQQALRRRTIIRDQQDVRPFLQSIYCCEEMRELIINVDLSKSTKAEKYVGISSSKEDVKLLSTLFARLPNLRYICLQSSHDPFYDQEAQERFSRAMLEASRLSSLEGLWIDCCNPLDDCMEHVCDLFPQLHCLRTLSVSSSVSWANEREAHRPIPEGEPPNGIRTLSLNFEYWYSTVKPAVHTYLSWLLTPRIDSPLQNLILRLPILSSSSGLENAWSILTAIDACLPQIEAVYIEAVTEDGMRLDDEDDRLPVLSEMLNDRLLSRTKNLKRLCLLVSALPSLQIPGSLEEFHVRYWDIRAFTLQWQDADQQLSSAVKLAREKSDRLRTLRISFCQARNYDLLEDGDDGSKYKVSLKQMVNTRALCEAFGIDFIVDRRLYNNSYDLIAEFTKR